MTTLHDRAEQLVSDLERMHVDAVHVRDGDTYYSPAVEAASNVSVEQLLTKVTELAILVQEAMEE